MDLSLWGREQHQKGTLKSGIPHIYARDFENENCPAWERAYSLSNRLSSLLVTNEKVCYTSTAHTILGIGCTPMSGATAYHSSRLHPCSANLRNTATRNGARHVPFGPHPKRSQMYTTRNRSRLMLLFSVHICSQPSASSHT